LDSSRRAFMDRMPPESSTTTGTSRRFSTVVQKARRLNPSRTSNVPSSVAATRSGNGCR
jgi:hypothetical protein